MNIILVTEDEITDHIVTLADHRAMHIVKVLQSEEGDTVRVGIIDGGRGIGRVVAINKTRPYSVRLGLQIGNDTALAPEIDVILALPRPIMLKRILSQIAALGVGRIYLIHANRVEKSFWEASLLAETEYRDHLRQGLEQAIDTRMPQVEMHRRFKPFVEDILPEIGRGYRFKLLAHPGGESTLAESLSEDQGRILLAVGPEGGWVDFEVKMFETQGFTSCSIGGRILKVDTAVIALHAQISAIRELLRSRREKKNEIGIRLDNDSGQIG